MSSSKKLDKLSDKEVINIAKKMFYGGFAFLPLLWLINAIYLFPLLRSRRLPQLKLYIYGSLIGALVWSIVFLGWYGSFVVWRKDWGKFGDDLTVLIPKGV